MKIIFYLSFLLLNLSLFAQHNTYRIKYLLDFQKDSIDSKSVNRELMFLDVFDTYAVFQSENLFKKDSISATSNPYALFGLPKPEFKYKIIQTNGSSKYFVDYSPSHRFYIIENEKLNWIFVNDSVKKIDTYSCKLATTKFKGRTYFAWYSLELPISFGPYKFRGLPGLIMEVYDDKKQYHFQMLSIKKINALSDYTENTKYKQISKQDLVQLENNIKNKPSLILLNSNLNLPKEGMDKYDNKHRELNKKFNNPIELTD